MRFRGLGIRALLWVVEDTAFLTGFNTGSSVRFAYGYSDGIHRALWRSVFGFKLIYKVLT